MNTHDSELPTCDATDHDIDESNISSALDALQPNARVTKLEMFQKHFDSIKAAIERKVSKTIIMETLAKSGLKLSPNTFNKMLDSENERRAKLAEGGKTKVDFPPNAGHDEIEEVA